MTCGSRWNRTHAIATDTLSLAADTAALPEATGYGLVRDLRQEMERDTSGALKAVVTQFTQAQNAAEREKAIENNAPKFIAARAYSTCSRSRKETSSFQAWGNCAAHSLKRHLI